MNRIKEARKKSGLKQSDLSARLGLSQAGLSLWENGKAEPGQDGWLMLSDILNVSVDFLMGREQEFEARQIPDAPPSFSDDENRLIDIYRSLSQQGKDYIFQQINIASQIYTKNASVPIAGAEAG